MKIDNFTKHLSKRYVSTFLLLCLSSCTYTHSHKEPNIPFNSFVRIEAKRHKANCFTCLLETGFGSGAVVASNKILTAGHICVGIREMIDNADQSDVLDKVIATIHDDEGNTYGATKLDIHPSGDMCIIETDRPVLVDTITVASSNPRRGRMVWSMMAPDGVSGTGLVPVVTGHYAGGDAKSSVFTIPAHPGASGGPVLNSAGELIGLVSQINKSFHHIVISPSLHLIKKFHESR